MRGREDSGCGDRAVQEAGLRKERDRGWKGGQERPGGSEAAEKAARVRRDSFAVKWPGSETGGWGGGLRSLYHVRHLRCPHLKAA